MKEEIYYCFRLQRRSLAGWMDTDVYVKARNVIEAEEVLKRTCGLPTVGRDLWRLTSEAETSATEPLSWDWRLAGWGLLGLFGYGICNGVHEAYRALVGP
jgi:hypothetical protein